MKAAAYSEKSDSVGRMPHVRQLTSKAGFRQSVSNLARGKYFRSVLLLASGAAISQAITLASTLVLARIYLPEDFGVLAIFVAAVSFLATISALRYEVAIPLPKRESVAVELMVLSLGCLLVVVGAVAFSLWSFGGWFVERLNGELLQPYLWLLPIGILGAGVYQILASWAVRNQNYSHLATANVSQALGQAVSQIAFGVLGAGSLGLISGDVIGRGGGGGILALRSWRARSNRFGQLTMRGVLLAARRYWRFPAIASWAAMLNTASIHLPLVLFAYFYDLEIVGCLALAQRILGAPTSLLSNSVSKVFLGECAKLRYEAPHRLPALFWKTVFCQGSLSAVLLLCVALPAPWLFGLVFGAQWQLAGWFVLLLSSTYMAKMIAFPLAASLDVLERQGLHILREIARLTLVTTAVFVAAKLELGPLAAVGVLSAATCLAYCFGVYVVWFAIQRSSVTR